MKPCPGYPRDSCLTMIQEWRDLCGFCAKTLRLSCGPHRPRKSCRPMPMYAGVRP